MDFCHQEQKKYYDKYKFIYHENIEAGMCIYVKYLSFIIYLKITVFVWYQLKFTKTPSWNNKYVSSDWGDGEYFIGYFDLIC